MAQREKKTWKRSEGLLDRYFGFRRKIGIKHTKKRIAQRGTRKRNEEENRKEKLSKMECSFHIKTKIFFYAVGIAPERLLSTKTGSSVQSLISCCYGISDLWGVYIFFIVNGYTKFNFCNVLFFPYFLST